MSITEKGRPDTATGIVVEGEPLAVLGVVLAGGLSRRMGGHSKSFVDLCGRPMIAKVLERLAPQVNALVINANDRLSEYDALGFPVLTDEHPERPGPLAGVLAGLRYASRMIAVDCRVLSVPVDVPFLPADLAERLAGAAVSSQLVAVASSAGRLHPTVALWPSSATGLLAGYLNSGGRRMHDVLVEVGYGEVAFPLIETCCGDLDPFFNVNTPDDTEFVRRALASVP